MPLKPSEPQPKSSCDKHKCNKPSTEKIKMPKKLLISKKWHPDCAHEVTTKSAGIITSKPPRNKPNKTSNSLPVVPKQSKILDFCKTCGDTDDIETAVAVFSNTVTNSTSKTSAVSSKNSKHAVSPKYSQQELKTDSQKIKMETKVVKQYYKNEKYADSKSTIDYTKTSCRDVKINTKKSKGALKTDKKIKIEEEVVQEHYLNEKFADLYDSMHDFDTIGRNGQVLDTITEVNEKQVSSDNKSTLSQEKSSEESNIFTLPSEDEVSLKKLKEFREKNYFECHSSKNRIASKGSVISLQDHKCRYRLYLNDRLFPVAIDNDHNDNIRCVDCHLPLELAQEEDKVNGTIQAKVKLGSETQDMVLLLPIKEPLIIKQKRKEKNDDDVVYFGLIKMDQNGNSMFNPTLPSDSLALRYQRGYRQFNDVQSYRYDKIEDSDVIYI
ncbi:uncharacterized protein LOC133529105 [Cydia pomonella]|uniref:uncharacterized protein LOC133529105 n=1 Tax=Cydia pomonella TaxID=82600 RepID=UPI002ADDEB55|nr:uncharacterized protein LOC133529105 [Cydia pomonella]